ncbi:hypothetical protein ACJDU8_12825 [Clostridium sp. WILCCON 0269]|uniref:AbiTii domain-containing protein n=1 Tax=Candidatus Clostridium eludens TaxID=3381663 RepID=A0ABW8SK82_9CLOT
MNTRISSTYNKLSTKVHISPLSELLPLALKLALELKDLDFEKWIHLEYEGYFNTNPYLTSEIKVPKYRIVVGNYLDIYARLINVQNPKFNFINEYRLRHGVAELENLSKNEQFITISDPDLMDFVNKNLNINALCFRFSPSCIQDVLSSIRARLIDNLSKIKIKYDIKITSSTEITNRWTRDNKIGVIVGIIGVIVAIVLANK